MRALPAALLLLLPAWLACAVEEIAFVTRPLDSSAGAGATSASISGEPCSTSDDCELGEYCALASCESTLGSCRQPQTVCGSLLAPVCGCDGVTYFNDCLREASGVGAATPGACQINARRCGLGGMDSCPADGGFCAKLASGLLSLAACAPRLPDLPGVCWVLPFSCDAASGADRWVSCAEAAPPRCVDTCGAVRSELPHVRALSCPP